MVLVLLFVAALVLLPLIWRREASRAKRQRAAYFTDAVGMLDSYRITQSGPGFPVVEGRYRGRAVRLEPVVDDLTWRKLPSLWLKATVLAPNPGRGTLGFLARAQGNEVFSPTVEMRHRLAIPAEWEQQHAILCTDDPSATPVLSAAAFNRIGFADPRMKELVITPKGVRLVYQAAQGERAAYLVLRQAKFDAIRADATLIQALLDRTIQVSEAIDAATPISQAA